MKLEFNLEWKSAFRLDEADTVKRFRQEMKNHQNFDWEADRAVRLATGKNQQILKYTAQICRNPRHDWDYFGDGTGYADVQLTIFTWDLLDGCYRIICDLSDIWQLSSENEDKTRRCLYIKHYTEDR